ncbi:hypothetical protein GCM10027059_32860 [Myceligenerans halotolerans]
MASYLLIIGDREALGWILTESRTAFPSAGRREVAELREGDTLFLYTTRGCFKNPTRDRGRVIGTTRVGGPVERLDEPVRFSEREFPVGCPIEIGALAYLGLGVDLAPLVEDLDAFGRTEHAWSIHLRRPLLRMSDDDAVLLTDRLKPAPEHAQAMAVAGYRRWYRGLPAPGDTEFEPWAAAENGVVVNHRGLIPAAVVVEYERTQGR